MSWDLPIGVFFNTSMLQPGRLEHGPLEKFGFFGLMFGFSIKIIFIYIYFKKNLSLFFLYIIFRNKKD